jgi:uncharacterized membrane protein YraQ (UPF0718 family)
MKILIDFLRANPMIGLIFVVLFVFVLVFILKKLFKLALILGLIFLVASGALFHISHLEFAKKGKELLQSAEKTVATKVRKYIPGFDSTRADTAMQKVSGKKKHLHHSEKP